MAVGVLWLLPLWMSPLLLAMLCVTSRSRNDVRHQLLRALERVGAEEMRLRTGGDDTYVMMRAVRRVRTLAWVAVVLGVLLFPWPPGVLLLSTAWPLTKSHQKTPFREQLQVLRMKGIQPWSRRRSKLTHINDLLSLYGLQLEFRTSPDEGGIVQ